jgi:hypothetical protein
MLNDDSAGRTLDGLSEQDVTTRGVGLIVHARRRARRS